MMSDGRAFEILALALHAIYPAVYEPVARVLAEHMPDVVAALSGAAERDLVENTPKGPFPEDGEQPPQVELILTASPTPDSLRRVLDKMNTAPYSERVRRGGLIR